MAATPSSTQSKYNTFLSRPVWPKSHRSKLQESYKGSSKEELDQEESQRRHHVPLGASVSHTGRRAGTSGSSYGNARHPDDHPSRQNGLEAVIASKRKLTSDEQETLRATARDAAQPEAIAADFKRLFNDPRVVISARDVKNLTPDFNTAGGDAEQPQRKHGFARYTLPVTESELKAQDWEGKHEEHRKKQEDVKKAKEQDDENVKPNNGSRHEDASAGVPHKGGGMSTTDQKENRERAPGAEQGESTDEMTSEQKAFLDNMIAEAETVSNFKNASGEPPETELSMEAYDQVDFELQSDDQFTPDNWIPRSSHLLRLTGKHPLNAECDLRELFDSGLITPVKYHYVRNHGSVPKLAWETHRLEVYSDVPGLLPKSRSFSMGDIAAMHVSEVTATLACDGNRRGEVNMIKRSAGFTWGASGVSTCRWRGVFVRDILLACGFEQRYHTERYYLNYEGADEPSEGKYATSIPLAHAMNPQNDVMLAFGLNGRVLSPDHGYPLRSLIPGYVGGRQVKWLKNLWISKEPNSSHYHIWDNRVVPSFITDKNTIEGKAFFHHPDTAVMDMVLESVICRPSQDEFISLSTEDQTDNMADEGSMKDTLSQTYRLEGFAYNGGGNIVQKVEISLDGGKTWRYCFRNFIDEPLRHGEKAWAWIFWFCDVSLRDLCQTSEIMVRAFDQHKNTQPEHISWNFMGMQNNAIYRVRLHVDVDPITGKPSLRARHPIASGGRDGGWMKESPEEIAKAKAADAATSISTEFTLEEVEKHNSANDAWLIIDGKVYDVTSVLAWHPGGASAILNYAGKATAQATADYNAVHDEYARKKTLEVLIGKVSEKGIKTLQDDQKKVNKRMKEQKEDRKDFALKPFSYLPAKLIRRKEVNVDTRLYTFELPKINGKPGKMGLPICRHVQIASHWQDSVVMRPYTPTRPVLPHEEDGTFDLLVKTYLPEASPFPPGGTLGNYLDAMQEGETIDINGPTGEISYLGDGKFQIDGSERTFDKINLVAGGSGITPHWQLIHAVLKNPDGDKTRLSLLDSNKSYNDILLVDELQRYADDHGDQFKLWHTVSKKPEDREWRYSEGHLDQRMMEEHFYAPEDSGRVATFLCGPPGLIEKGATPALLKMGFKKGETLFGF